MANSAPQATDKYTFFFIFAILLLLVFRAAAVIVTPLGLGPDEAQYWRWGQSFEWGYFSKPPVIAWIIGATTGVFGDQEWAIRIASPVFHAATSFILFATGRRFWSAGVGILAGLTYALMPGVFLSATLMSTDVTLLTFWSLALYFFLDLRRDGKLGSAIGLGVALGLGFLSKYAMVYFFIGLGLAMIFDKPSRKALLGPNGIVGFALTIMLLIPHLLWNAANGFKTVEHTADNANWGASLVNPDHAIKFFVDQFGVFGPVNFLLLIIFFGIAAVGRARMMKEDAGIRVLLGFILPPLLIILLQAFISRAHANWAATAYPAACLLIGVWAMNAKGWVRILLILGMAANMIAGTAYTAGLMLPTETQIKLGAANASKRLRGWPETVDAVNAEIARTGASAVIVDEREIWHGLDYYGRDGAIPVPVKAWRRENHPKSASEEAPLTEEDTRNALILSYRKKDQEKMAADFKSFEPAGQIEIDLGGGKFRRLDVFIARGFEPKPR